MGQIEDIEIFIRIVEAGGIGSAAEQLNIAKSAVSRRLSELEKRLGTKLINRTTRVSNLTEEGKLYYQQGLGLLNHLQEFNQLTSNEKQCLKGTLRIAVPVSFGILHLPDVIDEFSQMHPDLTIDIHFSDSYTDLIEGGFDLALRIGNLKDSTLVAKKITTINPVVITSKHYLKTIPPLKHPTDLQHCNLLHYSYVPNVAWTFLDEDQRQHTVKINKASIMANNGDFLLKMVSKGHGVAITPTFIAYNAIASGEVEVILDNYHISPIGLYAVYPQSHFLAIRTRKFIDFIADKYGSIPYWDRLSSE
jgi:DNA-binding transcriptional LysR family regulator